MAKTGWTSKGQGQANPTITHPVTRRSLLSPPSTKGLPPVMGQLCNKMKLLSDKIPAHVKTCQLLHQLPYHIFLALLLKQSNKFQSLFKVPMNCSQIFKPWNLDFQFQRLSTTITMYEPCLHNALSSSGFGSMTLQDQKRMKGKEFIPCKPYSQGNLL